MENKKVFIGNLDFSATEDELQSLVSRFGTIVSIKLNQKKGFAFIEMESAEDAGKVVQELDGTKHRNREIRLSLEMKARKARSVSARRYKDRGATLARQRSENFDAPEEQRTQDRPFSPGRPAHAGQRPGAARGPKPESGYKPRERSASPETRPPRPYSGERIGSERPPKKPWSSDKPSYAARSARDGQRTGAARGPKTESSYKPRERSATSETRPLRPYSGERTGSSRKPKKQWTAAKPSYPGRPARDSERPDAARGPKPESRYRSRERSTTTETRPPRPYSSERTGPPRSAKKPWSTDKPSYAARPARDGQRPGSARPLKKEWSSQGPARPSVKTGEDRADRPERKSPFSPKPRDYSKPRSTGGSQNRFSKPSRPGAAGVRSSSGPSKPKPRGNYAGRGKPPRRD